MSRVVIAGAGALGQVLATKLAATHDVRCVRSSDVPSASGRVSWHRADLSTTPEAEVALAGAETVVLLAHAKNAPARLPRASPEDLNLLIADSVARAAKRVGAKHLVHFSSGERDARLTILERSGVPLSVLVGGGSDPAAALAQLVEQGPGAKVPALGAWSGVTTEPAAPRMPTCSVQRYLRPPGWTALDLARAYFTWVASDVPLVSTSEVAGVFHVRLAGVEVLQLQRSPGRSDDDCAWLTVSGGALNAAPTHPDARFEFRVLLDGETAMAALIGFHPALPWTVYRFTQAVMHERTMRRFGDWLNTQRGAPPP